MLTTSAATLAREVRAVLNTWRLLEPDLFEIYTRPDFAIGQRALLVPTASGNFVGLLPPRADHDWVMRPDSAIRFWQGDSSTLGPGAKLLRLGGHFPGMTALHGTPRETGKGCC